MEFSFFEEFERILDSPDVFLDEFQRLLGPCGIFVGITIDRKNVIHIQNLLTLAAVNYLVYLNPVISCTKPQLQKNVNQTRPWCGGFKNHTQTLLKWLTTKSVSKLSRNVKTNFEITRNQENKQTDRIDVPVLRRFWVVFIADKITTITHEKLCHSCCHYNSPDWNSTLVSSFSDNNSNLNQICNKWRRRNQG